jgi:histidinol-phosphate/aromatic aminotransferase/cobyric acid decarboxylase-like protein/choline kinase
VNGQRPAKAIILAAGAGRRLGPAGERHPKPLLKVNGIPILGNCLASLRRNGIDRVVIVVGHLKDQIIAAAEAAGAGMSLSYVVSERYATTNNIYSLWLARADLNEDILLLEGDVFFEGGLIGGLIDCASDNALAVSPFARGMDGSVVTLDGAGKITALIEGRDQGPGFDYRNVFKTVNICKLGQRYLSDEFVPALDGTIQAGQTGIYYESLFKESLRAGRHAFGAVDCRAERWYEIDDHSDLRAAEYLFASPEQRYHMLQAQHGGMWRHDVVDHTYLYNLHFPTAPMWQRLADNFVSTAQQYPVGQQTLAEIASAALDLPAESLVIANGASELIKILCSRLGRRIIVPVPSFNEYQNATPPDKLTLFLLPEPDFELDPDAFAAAAERAGADVAVVVSPNNPTSLAVSRDNLARLATRLAKRATTLIVDESFIDFAPDPGALTMTALLADHPNLAIVKSLSKAYGICGLRLGYLCSADPALVATLRAELPIWNVNGFAEEFLRILPRFYAAHLESCRKTRADTLVLYEALRRIPGVDAFPPSANYVFVRLPGGASASAIAQRLFMAHDLLVKDCAGKTMPSGDRYMRISARTQDENRRAAAMLQEMLEATS